MSIASTKPKIISGAPSREDAIAPMPILAWLALPSVTMPTPTAPLELGIYL
jgi:hypothetical protein